jgi:HlyD family secretion protein
VAALIVICLGMMWSGVTEPSRVRYATVPVRSGEIRQRVTTTGTLRAVVDVEVGSPLSGQIAKIFADFNDEVHNGQPLAQLDQRTTIARLGEERAALEAAKAGVGIAAAKLERARVDMLDAQTRRAVLQARVDIANVAFQSAKGELQRKGTLRERGTGSVLQEEDAQYKFDSASASVREANALAAAHEHTVAGSEADFSRAEAELAAAQAAVPQHEALVQEVEIELERTVIRSPVDGVVVGRNVNEGQTLATSLESKTLFVVAGDLQKLEVHAKIDEADIGRIETGQKAVFSVDAFPNRSFVATVRQVRKAPDTKDNVVTYTVILRTDNPDRVLLPGMTAVAHIEVSHTGNVLKIPLSAVRFSPRAAGSAKPENALTEGRPAVIWRVDDDGALTPVAVGLGDDDSSDVAVLSGPLKEGESIATGEAVEPAGHQLFGIRLGF